MNKRDGPDVLSTHLDPHRLDEEWVSHADKMQQVGEMVAAANDLADRLESKAKLVKAQVELRCRRKPSAFGIDKVTESIVEAAVIASDEYQEALRKYHRAKLRAAELRVAYDARKDCRPALENLVKLHLGGYHAEPKGPTGAQHSDAMRLASRDIEKPLTRKKKRSDRGRPA